MRTPNEENFEPVLPAGHLVDGRFQIGSRLSRSRMSTIYHATDTREAGRRVAIKFPLLTVESDPAGYAQFQREQEIGLKLRHPSLLRFDTETAEAGRPHIVMEFLDGCTLADLLSDRGPLPVPDALRIAAAMAEAVAALHRCGFVHRDLKPANVVLCRDHTLRLIDFGQATPPERGHGILRSLTPVVGTPEYIAPEQIDRGPVDERTDVYSLGAILYEMLTGITPLQNPDSWAGAFRRTTGDPEAPRAIRPAIPEAVEEIVLRALQRAPENRYATAAELAEDLRAPERVTVTGLASRLQRPHWKLSLNGTPLLAGILLGLGAVGALVAAFVALVHLLPQR